MIKAGLFLGYLKKMGFTFFSGVPCSFLKSVFREISSCKNIRYIPAVKEDIALGVCSGAYLSGKGSVVLMQNSGLGHIVNALTSFNLIYKVPVLLVITWRGYKGKDAPEHLIMGKKLIPLLNNLGVPYRILTVNYKRDLRWALNTMREGSIPVALIVKKGVIR